MYYWESCSDFLLVIFAPKPCKKKKNSPDTVKENNSNVVGCLADNAIEVFGGKRGIFEEIKLYITHYTDFNLFVANQYFVNYISIFKKRVQFKVFIF